MTALPPVSRRLLLALVVVLVCCAGDLPHPPYTSQTADAWASAAFPPPPARGEYVPRRPARGTVWIDGEWLLHEREWSWKVGRWIMPPPGAAFALWAVVRDREGSVRVASGRWLLPDGGEVAEPEPLSEGRVVGGAVVDTEGRVERTVVVRRQSDTERPQRAIEEAGDAAARSTP